MTKNNTFSLDQQTMKAVSRFYQILSEGQRGHHILFSSEMIRMTFEKDSKELSKLFNDNIDEINRVLNESMVFQGLDQKRDLIEKLPKDIQRALVYGYFQLLETQEPQKQTLH